VVFTNVIAVIDARTKEKGSRVARMRDMNEHTWVAKPQTFDRPRCRWDDDIKLDLQEIRREIEWVQLAQGGLQRLACANTILRVWVLQTAEILVTS
jgi:hypothetical protein